MIKFTYANIHNNTDKYHSYLALAQRCATDIIQNLGDEPKYKIFDFQTTRQDIDNLSEITKHIKDRYKNIIIVAMGGAMLNPQSLLNLNGALEQKNIYFLGNTDPIYFENLVQKIDLQDSAIIIISNSGNTLETIALSKMMIATYKNANINEYGKHFFFITNPINGALQKIAKDINAMIIPHQAGISGRFSGLTNVTTFIGIIAGIDIEEYLNGAESALTDFINNPHAPSIIAAANISTAAKPIMVSLAYLQQFNYFLEWYCQIIAESLGKNNQSITPIRGLGPNDQHSMLQLYIEGPDDKFYNFFYVSNLGTNQNTNSDIFSYLRQINDINFTATKETLESIGSPLRSIMLPDLSAHTIGDLTANMMLETILLCKMAGVNPFDQPGVELIKTRTNKLVA